MSEANNQEPTSVKKKKVKKKLREKIQSSPDHQTHHEKQKADKPVHENSALEQDHHQHSPKTSPQSKKEDVINSNMNEYLPFIKDKKCYEDTQHWMMKLRSPSHIKLPL